MTGRPAWIPTDSICEQAREMASNGLTVAQIANCLGISESTLYAKQGEYKEFLDAIKRGALRGYIRSLTHSLRRLPKVMSQQ
jgi:predicted transcriptional regulator